MLDSVLLSTPTIVVLSVVALLLAIGARFVANRFVRSGMYIASFLCVTACVIYALLLSAQLKEILVYILLFAVIGVTAFFPTAEKIEENSESKPDGGEEDEL